MSIVHLPDSASKTITLMQCGDKGQYLASRLFSPDILENIHKVEIEEDDVLLCSYPKSGCHWLWEMARMLRAGTSRVDLVEKEQYMLGYKSQEELLKLPPRRIFNTHAYFYQLPQNVQDGKVKILFIYRNPKDVAVSFYNHHRKIFHYEYQGEFSDYLTGLFLKGNTDCGGFFSYTRDWERVVDSRPDLPIFVVSYEELQADTFHKAKEMAAFLGSSADDDTIQGILDKCSFSSMQERKGGIWAGQIGMPQKYDEPVIYRKGKVGDWKNWFTVSHSEMMDQVIEKEMKGSRFQFQYTL